MAVKNIIITAVLALGVAAPTADATTNRLTKARAEAKTRTVADYLCGEVDRCNVRGSTMPRSVGASPHGWSSAGTRCT